jgi:hypothetical protein
MLWVQNPSVGMPYAIILRFNHIFAQVLARKIWISFLPGTYRLSPRFLQQFDRDYCGEEAGRV